MNKTIDLKDSVYDICRKYPEAKGILAGSGFHDITKAGVLNTVGKLMTIPRGASMRGIALPRVIQTFRDSGFEIGDAVYSENIAGGSEGAAFAGASAGAEADTAADDKDSRTALLKGYVNRLSAGESLDDVREDFVRHFHSVDAAEIANAEQELISSGTPVTEVQRLCDVHSALFHGATREEQIANAEKAVQASAAGAGSEAGGSLQAAGHPISVFTAENDAVSGLINEIRASAAAGEDGLKEKLEALHDAAVHYAEKGDLLYPVLKSKYSVSGPADVMWGVDDEIRDELKLLSEAGTALPNFPERLDKLLSRAEEMIYKENNILFPICAQNFSEEDWMRVYYELPVYDKVLSCERPLWDAAEERRKELQSGSAETISSASDVDAVIRLGSGHMTAPQIEAVLNTIPMELTFIDDKNINCFFNDGSGKKLFKRPAAAVDREVFTCHPPKYAAMARQIIDELRKGEKDSVDVWMEKRGEPVLVRYMAVRDKNGAFAGTLECVQRMGFARKHFAAAEE